MLLEAYNFIISKVKQFHYNVAAIQDYFIIINC